MDRDNRSQGRENAIEHAVPKRPVDEIPDGALKATIWRNEGKKADYFKTKFAKTIKDKNGNYQDVQSFDGDDLLRISELARRAHHRVEVLQREEFKARRAQRDSSDRAPRRER